MTDRRIEIKPRLTTFDAYCSCGGYAYELNGRNPRDPHTDWCPQREQYAEWVAAGGYDALIQKRKDIERTRKQEKLQLDFGDLVEQ